MLKYWAIIFILFSIIPLTAQEEFFVPTTQNPKPSIEIKRAQSPIILDGNIDEASWNLGKGASDFHQYFPTDTTEASAKTLIYFTYDEDFLYVAAKCYSKGSDFMVPSLRRDYRFNDSDNISFLFDTYNDKTNAFVFGINALGVRREALISGGGRNRGAWNESWDNKWDGVSKIHENYWACEIAIPFNTIRFKEGSDSWRFNSYRMDIQMNEISTWVSMPRNNIVMDLGFMSELKWDEPLQSRGKNISLIPYVTASSTRDFEDIDQTSPVQKFNIGGDAKVALSSSLNLDLTFNPDFSQVEVDQQVTNLDRFEIFFPERRQFFLENSDLFGSFGVGRVNPFFSRRIGVAVDTSTGGNIQNAILYGARVSGKLNNRTRVGLLNMQTASDQQNDLPSFNYTVAALERTVFGRSNIAFLFVNKQALNQANFGETYDTYNRVAGIEYRLASNDNKWSGKTAYHRALTQTEEKDKYFHMAQIQYNVRSFRLEWAHVITGNGFDAQVGFVPRKDIALFSPEAELKFYPKADFITEHSIGFDTRWIYKIGSDDNEVLQDFGLADQNTEVEWRINFSNFYRLNFFVNRNRILLLSDFDPTRLQDEDIFLPAGNVYKYIDYGFSFNTDQRKAFQVSLSPTFGGFYNGKRIGVNTNIRYRIQPYGSIALSANYNKITLAAPFVPTNLWLIGPRIDLTFTKKLFLTTFIQYNNQQDNLNINARFQWRFKPVSDFFIVYTNNYITDQFSQFDTRNRAIVAKLTYWLNL